MDSIHYIGAGLFHLQFKDTNGTVVDCFGVVDASGDPKGKDVTVTGDDIVLGKFIFSQEEDLKITANALSFDALGVLTGNTPISDADSAEIPLGTDSEKNAPFIEILAESVSKSPDGTAATVTKTWHKAQVQKIKITQQGEKELSVEIEATAYPTLVDIGGTPLVSQRISTLEAAANTP
jgi:hypothetical protein